MKITLKLAQVVDPSFKEALGKLLLVGFTNVQDSAAVAKLCQQADAYLAEYNAGVNALVKRLGKPQTVIKEKYRNLVNSELLTISKSKTVKDRQAKVDRLIAKYGEPSKDKFQVPQERRTELESGIARLAEASVEFTLDSVLKIPANANQSVVLTGRDIYVLNGLAEVGK